jgi:hypothetical protein
LFGCKSGHRKIVEQYQDGKVKIEYVFKDDGDIIDDSLINGKELAYDSLGNLAREIDYSNGKANGQQKIYFENGNIWKLWIMRNDSTIGYMYEFKENGDTVKARIAYGLSDNGTFYKKWLPNGLVLTGNYGNSDRTFFIWKWLSKSGSLLKTKVDSGSNGTFVSPEC